MISHWSNYDKHKTNWPNRVSLSVMVISSDWMNNVLYINSGSQSDPFWFYFSFVVVMWFNAILDGGIVADVLFVTTLPVVVDLPKQSSHLNCRTEKIIAIKRVHIWSIGCWSQLSTELKYTNLFLIKRNTRRFITNKVNINTPWIEFSESVKMKK